MPETFKIRGHHLGIFLLLHQLSKQFGTDDVVMRCRMICIYNIQTIRFDETRESVNMTPVQYSVDVIGSTTEDRQNHESRLETVFLKFLLLSDQDLVLFTADSDGICEACHHGTHCKSINRKREQFALGQVVGGVNLDDTMIVAKLKRAFDRRR